MARPKSYKQGTRPFYPRGAGLQRGDRGHAVGSGTVEQEVMMDDVKRASMGYYVRNLSRMLGRHDKVDTDSELEQKAREFFDYCADADMFPTIEAFSLYIGYSIGTIHEWAAGRKPLRHDMPGVDTMTVIKRIKTAFASLDGYLAMDGSANTVAYIFRAKNYYDMVNEDRISHSVESAIPAPMSTSEIAALVGMGDKLEEPVALPPVEDEDII